MLVIDLHADGGSTGIAVSERTRLDGDAVIAMADLLDRLAAGGSPIDLTCEPVLRRLIETSRRRRSSP